MRHNFAGELALIDKGTAWLILIAVISLVVGGYLLAWRSNRSSPASQNWIRRSCHRVWGGGDCLDDTLRFTGAQSLPDGAIRSRSDCKRNRLGDLVACG